MSDGCYFCGGGSEVIEQHHIVPRRFGGGDESENLVEVCPTCHEKLERLYDKRFYDELGIEKEVGVESDRRCAYKGCESKNTRLLRGDDVELAVCDEHRRCARRGCGKKTVTPISGMIDGRDEIKLYCDDHRTCHRGSCANDDVKLVKWARNTTIPFCDVHADDVTGVNSDVF